MHHLTYSHSLQIPLTRSCGAHCTYCTFKKDGDPLLSFDQIEDLIRQHYDSGICEVVLSAGQSLEALPEIKTQWIARGYSSFIAYVRDICQLILEHHLIPTLDIGPLSYVQLDEVAPYAASITLLLENVNPEFCRSVQTNKSIDLRIETLSDTGLKQIPVNTGVLMGAGESSDDLIRSVDAIAEVHGRHGHVQSLVLQGVVGPSGASRRGTPDLRALLQHVRDVMPDVAVTMPFTAPGWWLDTAAGDVDDIGWAFEGFDGLDWSRPFPKVTEIERQMSRRGLALKPRLPLFPKTFHKFKPGPEVRPVFDEWLKKREFQYYLHGGTAS